MILRRGTEEGHTANVNIFDGIRVCNIWFGDGLFKWIEIDSDEIDVIPAEIKELLAIFWRGTGKQSTVDGGVQRFDASAKDFRRLGVICDFGDRYIVVSQQFCSAA